MAKPMPTETFLSMLLQAARLSMFIINAVESHQEARTAGPGYPVVWYERIDAPGPSVRLIQDMTELARAKQRLEANPIYRMFVADDEPGIPKRRGRPPKVLATI